MRSFRIFIEEWRPVLGYEGFYEVSNYGRIKSLPRMARYKATLRSVPARFLQLRIGTHGYLATQLYKNKAVKTMTVHKLVAQAFLGPRPFGLFVHHIDFDRLNNHAWNLTYVLFLENLRHRNLCKGERMHSSKLRTVDIPTIRQFVRGGMSHAQIGRMFSVSDAAVRDIAHGKTWKHVA